MFSLSRPFKSGSSRKQSHPPFPSLADSGNCIRQRTLLTSPQSTTYRTTDRNRAWFVGTICCRTRETKRLVEHRRTCLQHFIFPSLSTLGFISWIKREPSIKWRLFKAAGFSPLLGERAGDDLFPSSCYPDGETQTDLRVPEGLIFLAASKHVFLFLNVTYCSNRKQVCGAGRQL